ncbi:hypothetical protein FQA39_LY01937 [Lamprigera yunnana]|nr:hypothetical protein FQA39_LY01937 [Lamprigera yunnana]
MDASVVSDTFLPALIGVVDRALKFAKANLTVILLAFFLGSIVITTYAVLLTLPIFLLYKLIVYLKLKLIHNDEFVGFVQETTYEIDSLRNVTVILLKLKYEGGKEMREKNVLKDVKDIVRTKILKNPNFFKFQCRVENCMGYLCLFKEEVDVEQRVKEVKNENDANDFELMKLISQCSTQPLPTLWDVFVGTTPNSTDNNCDTISYPVLFRIHEEIADGVALLQILSNIFVNAENPQVCGGTQSEVIIQKIKTRLFKSLICLLNNLYFLLSLPILLYNLQFKHLKMVNSFFKVNLKGTQIFAFSVEESQVYVDKIKKIKKKLKGVSFPDIVLSSVSASLRDHCWKYSPLEPEFLRVAIYFLSDPADKNLLSTKNELNSIKTYGNSSIAVTNLPMFLENINKNKCTLLQRLRLVRNETCLANRVNELRLNHFIKTALFPIFPKKLVNVLYGKLQCSGIVSFVPGPNVIKINGNLSISDCVYWTPQQNSVGINFSMITYDNRLCFGINGDELFIRNETIGKEILDSIYKYIDLLEEEIPLKLKKVQ